MKNERKLKDFLQTEQFNERKNMTVSVVIKFDKELIKNLLAMKKRRDQRGAVH